MSDILQELRQALQKSELSRYAISKMSGIDQGQLSRFLSGQTVLGVAIAEKLADCLGMEIVLRKRKKKGK